MITFAFSPRLAGLAALSAAALTLSACGNGLIGGSDEPSSSASGSAASVKVVIGFSPTTLQAPALKGLADGLTGYAKSKGWEVLTADPKGDPATQKQQIDGWVQRGQVTAVWIIPASPEALQASVKAAQAKGVVVLASGKPADYGFSAPEAGVSFSSVDNVAYGTKLAESLGKCATERLGGAAKIINVVEPASSGTANKEIDAAVKAGLTSSSPGSTVLADVNSGADRLKAQTNTASALQAHQDANAAIGTNDEATLGALGAMEAAGKDPAKSCIVGAGGGDEAVAAVKSGKLYSELAFDFAGDMTQSADLLASMAADPKAVGQSHTVPLKEVDK